jgi:hypothetical protein
MEISSNPRILKRVVPATEFLLPGSDDKPCRVAFREPLGDNVIFYKFDPNIAALAGHHLEIWVVEVKDTAKGEGE